MGTSAVATAQNPSSTRSRRRRATRSTTLRSARAGTKTLLRVDTKPCGAAKCSAAAQCSGRAMAYGNTVDGCQCVCDDTFGGADCSCAKSGTCLGATVFRARAANVAAVTTLACLGERVAGWDVWPRQACAVQPTSAPCTSTCTAKRGRRPHFPKSLASLATTDVSTTPQVYNTCCNWHHHCGRCRAHCECEPAASLRTEHRGHTGSLLFRAVVPHMRRKLLE